MFQRIRGAIDRTIAEEQARQKIFSDESLRSRSASTSSRANDSQSLRNRPISKNDTLNPDPAVFETAFVIDDSDEPPRSEASEPSTSKNDGYAAGTQPISGKSNAANSNEPSGSEEKVQSLSGKVVAKQCSNNADPGLPPEIKQRLRKLEKLEATYPELLRSYRVAHKRATAIEPFEKALRESTPFTSINDPHGLIEYLGHLNLRNDMAMEELKKVSAGKEDLTRQTAEAQRKLEETTRELQALKSRMLKPKSKTHPPKSEVSDSESQMKPSFLVDNDEELFSYDEEISTLHNELESKHEQIRTLQIERDDLSQQLQSTKKVSICSTVSVDEAIQESNQIKLTDPEQQIPGTSNAQPVSQEGRAGISTTTQTEHEEPLTETMISKLSAELTQARAAEAAVTASSKQLESQVAQLQADESRAQSKIQELSEKIEQLGWAGLGSVVDSQGPAPVSQGKASKKKAKKRKGKNSASLQPTATGSPTDADNASESADLNDRNLKLEADLRKLEEEIRQKEIQIECLTGKCKDEEILRKEVCILRGDFEKIIQDHAEAERKIKELEEFKLSSQQGEELNGIQKKSASEKEAAFEAQNIIETLRAEQDELKVSSKALQAEVGAAQRLAQTRFKDLTDLREKLKKAQTELQNLRKDSSELQRVRADVSEKARQLRDSEKRGVSLEREVTSAQRALKERETEIDRLRERLQMEINGSQQAEEARRVADRNLRRAEAEKIELCAKCEKIERTLQTAQSKIRNLRPQVQEMEERLHLLKREKAAAQEEAEFKSQQYVNFQGLLNSMRDQGAEMSTQLKEAKSQVESLEEELGEAQMLLLERTREGETMRRLLSEADTKAETKVQEWRERMEEAIAERERIEYEGSRIARKKTREVEEVKNRTRELEREVKSLTRERGDLESRLQVWERRKEELEASESKTSMEIAEMQATISRLRSALDASERQLSDKERRSGELSKMLEETRQQYERAARELETVQARSAASLSGSPSPDPSRRNSVNGGDGSRKSSDTKYLKTILLQFLEQRDGRLRTQLVPVLGKLLQFDKSEEQQWLSVVQRLEIR